MLYLPLYMVHSGLEQQLSLLHERLLELFLGSLVLHKWNMVSYTVSQCR